MAKLSAHGDMVGTLEFLTTAKRYMSDGNILRNVGFGWKLYAQVKPGIAPADAFGRARQRLEAKLVEFPAMAAYRRELHGLAGLCKRWKLHAAVQMMPDDPDGVWSEACDGYGDNVCADIDEVVQLCTAWKAAQYARQALETA